MGAEMWHTNGALHRRERGQALIEYAVVLALVGVVVLAALGGLGSGVSSALQDVSQALGRPGCNVHAAEHCHHQPPISPLGSGKGKGKGPNP